ncbi:DUF4870 family protein [Modicisalibacter ilicicola]|nr:hypothetical protein [Halomonas ilicicola]
MPTPVDNDRDFASQKANSPGRGAAILIYAFYLGSVMAVVTAPLGVAIAHFKLGRGAAWVDSHFRFQIRTFWLGVVAGGIGLLLWNLLGYFEAPPGIAWALGYLFFTACLVWMVGRCGVGIHRLMANRPIDNPRSLGFGGAVVTLHD